MDGIQNNREVCVQIDIYGSGYMDTKNDSSSEVSRMGIDRSLLLNLLEPFNQT